MTNLVKTCVSSLEELMIICKDYHDRIYVCEGQKWDLEYEVRKREFEVESGLILGEMCVFTSCPEIKLRIFPFSHFRHTCFNWNVKINELNSQVNDLKGKFIKPSLKKVSKYENKFAKLQKKAAQFNFANQLKQVKKKEFTLEEEKEEANLNFFLHQEKKIKTDLGLKKKEDKKVEEAE
ncbi:unnamed protein product [Notodromas monacha]|uniref:Uncharacterized protein n=1 Tax=Notodromas monacha TaxID=399045 RepID=A0A7R9GGE4_9CRUS|nr:unnamed protein product [Notodromas monacha]CAG0920123.1 unnamed protein product [Notodromas monacha]